MDLITLTVEGENGDKSEFVIHGKVVNCTVTTDPPTDIFDPRPESDDEGLRFWVSPGWYEIFKEDIYNPDALEEMHSSLSGIFALTTSDAPLILLTGTEESFMDPEEDELPELEIEYDGRMIEVLPPNYGYTEYRIETIWSPAGHAEYDVVVSSGAEINDGFLPSEVGGEWRENADSAREIYDDVWRIGGNTDTNSSIHDIFPKKPYARYQIEKTARHATHKNGRCGKRKGAGRPKKKR